MHRDHKLGLALGVLIVGFAAALCFPKQSDVDQRLLQLENTADLDADIAQLPVHAYINAELPVETPTPAPTPAAEPATVFGPVASVIPFDTPEEAIAIANDTIYGLAAGIWTRDVSTALRFVREIQAGVVWVNTFDESDMTVPFGGFKQSGNAKDNCIDSVRSYTQEKSAWIRI